MDIQVIEAKKILSPADKQGVRNKMMAFEEELSKFPTATFGDDACPLKHKFVDGAYVRTIFMPKGMLLTSKIHKKCHPYFIMKGDCSVLTEEGVVRLKAPYHGITQPGTKRVLYMHEDTIWITVHVTEHKDLDKIEEEIIAKTFDEVQLTHEDVKKLKEAI
jgi:hypothetical protein